VATNGELMMQGVTYMKKHKREKKMYGMAHARTHTHTHKSTQQEEEVKNEMWPRREGEIEKGWSASGQR
jgi:hypothetical protein